jgi:hypothetical protein
MSDLVGEIHVTVSKSNIILAPDNVRKGTMAAILDQVFQEASYKLPGCQFLECVETYTEDAIDLHFFFAK